MRTHIFRKLIAVLVVAGVAFAFAKISPVLLICLVIQVAIGLAIDARMRKRLDRRTGDTGLPRPTWPRETI